MNRFYSAAILALFMLLIQDCSNQSSKAPDISPEPVFTPLSLPAAFNDYWYQGKAELSSYDVVQERYGELRQAEQINIFVTEDFSRSKQVKLDNPQQAGADRIPILKLNSLRRFETGIYDYSIMQSIFTPTSGMPTLKTTTSVQDWCGHVFMQTNLVSGGYRTRVFSYFESEGDQELLQPAVLLEDEIWTLIRLNPNAIKNGKIKVLPSGVYARLRHKPLDAQDADIQVIQGDSTVSYLRLNYLSIPRALKISFEASFPHKILGWEETIDGKMASKGTLKSIRISAYWAEHDNINASLRDSLKLGHNN